MEQSVSPERWLPVVGYEGLYEVSDQGCVRSVPREVPDSRGWTRRYKGVLLKSAAHSSGDGRRAVVIYREGRGEQRLIAHLVAEAFIGPRPRGMHVLHRDDNAADECLTNLYYGTPTENAYDRVRNGYGWETGKTKCPEGHPLALPNLVRSSWRDGHRKCLACARARTEVRNHRVLYGIAVDFHEAAARHYERIVLGGPDSAVAGA